MQKHAKKRSEFVQNYVRYLEDVEYLRKNKAEFQLFYQGQWILIFRKRIIGLGDDKKRIDEIRARHDNWPVLLFLTPRPKQRIEIRI